MRSSIAMGVVAVAAVAACSDATAPLRAYELNISAADAAFYAPLLTDEFQRVAPGLSDDSGRAALGSALAEMSAAIEARDGDALVAGGMKSAELIDNYGTEEARRLDAPELAALSIVIDLATNLAVAR